MVELDVALLVIRFTLLQYQPTKPRKETDIRNKKINRPQVQMLHQQLDIRSQNTQQKKRCPTHMVKSHRFFGHVGFRMYEQKSLQQNR